MTREELITISRESGLEYYGLGKDRERFIAHLQRFAALVLANRDPQSSMSWQEGNEAGRLAEREACEKVCADLYSKWADELINSTDEEDDPLPPDAVDCKLAIRARGQA